MPPVLLPHRPRFCFRRLGRDRLVQDTHLRCRARHHPCRPIPRDHQHPQLGKHRHMTRDRPSTDPHPRRERRGRVGGPAAGAEGLVDVAPHADRCGRHLTAGQRRQQVVGDDVVPAAEVGLGADPVRPRAVRPRLAGADEPGLDQLGHRGRGRVGRASRTAQRSGQRLEADHDTTARAGAQQQVAGHRAGPHARVTDRAGQPVAGLPRRHHGAGKTRRKSVFALVRGLKPTVRKARRRV